jgi:hypothetical protein
MQLTDDAHDHEPTGDPDHVAFGKNYTWRCSCGNRGVFALTERKATRKARKHESHCPGETTVDVTGAAA